MPKPIGFFKEGGKTKPITRRKSGSSKMSRSSSSLTGKTVAEMEEITPELREKLQIGTYDTVSKSVEINGQKYYVVTNTDAEYLKEPLGYSDLEYIGISSATSGAVLFVQGEDAQELLTRFKNDGYEKFIKETKSEGYWEEKNW